MNHTSSEMAPVTTLWCYCKIFEMLTSWDSHRQNAFPLEVVFVFRNHLKPIFSHFFSITYHKLFLQCYLQDKEHRIRTRWPLPPPWPPPLEILQSYLLSWIKKLNENDKTKVKTPSSVTPCVHDDKTARWKMHIWRWWHFSGSPGKI